MASKRNVKYVQQEEPSFLKNFKERVGYKEQASINDKYVDNDPVSVEKTDENEREIEDEKPVIVQLKQGDLSAEEVAEVMQKSCNEDCWDNVKDRPKFKKPEKRHSNENDARKDQKKKRNYVKAVKNSKLLSFDEDDEG